MIFARHDHDHDHDDTDTLTIGCPGCVCRVESDQWEASWLADALINWQAQTDEIVATLDSYRTTKACGHCDGRGYVAPT